MTIAHTIHYLVISIFDDYDDKYSLLIRYWPWLNINLLKTTTNYHLLIGIDDMYTVINVPLFYAKPGYIVYSA